MSSNELIEKLVVDASNDPLNPRKNFDIAREYENLGQTASAVGFYLRAAEHGHDTDALVVYTSLLRISICIEGQKDRNLTVSNVLLQAIAYFPDRPEAYFLLSKFHERQGNWQESYTFAEVGLFFSRKRIEMLPADVSYIGGLGLDFQKAVAAWWIGRVNESYSIFSYLKQNESLLPEEYKTAIDNNMQKIIESVF